MITQENIPYTADEIKAMVKTCEKYNKALERAKKLYEQGTITESLGYVFPELKESEDERIKDEILRLVSISGNGNQYEEIRSWIEKQGENKPTDNVEIKFCEGDKVVSNQDGKVYTVGTAYYVIGDGEDICLHDTDGNHLWTNRDDLNKNYHLWASEDNKPLDADKVIEWLNDQACLGWLEDVEVEKVVEQFKKDFGL